MSSLAEMKRAGVVKIAIEIATVTRVIIKEKLTANLIKKEFMNREDLSEVVKLFVRDITELT